MRPFLLFLLLSASTAASAQLKLYGLTAYGGANGYGVLYTILSDGSNFHALYSFAGGVSSAKPYGGLTLLGTKFYGTTRFGGSSGVGTIFSFDTVSQVFQKVADFTGANGASPWGDLTYYNGMLYGLAPLGGANGGGTVFAYDPVTGILSDQYDLSTSTGTNPYGNLTLLNNKLYFITSLGGSVNGGSLSVFDPVAQTCNDLYNFAALGYPHSGLVVTNNLLYGTEIQRGQSGAIFSFDPVAVTYTDVHDFTQADFLADAEYPNGLTVNNGVLYGSTQGSGLVGDGGAWYSFDPVANSFNQIATFASGSADVNGEGGWNPLAAPIALSDGTYAGTVPFGGDNYDGAVVLRGSNSNPPMHSFSGSDGQAPMYGSLFFATDPTSLPIRIIRFTGLLTDAGRVLDWTASQPAPGGWFQLQRSTDEVSFMAIDSVAAAGSPATGAGLSAGAGTPLTASYMYTDDVAMPGVNVVYYRLKMTDVNQVVTYSPIVALGLGGDGGDSLRLINTAVTGLAYLQYTSAGSSSALNLRVVNLSGHVMIQEQLPVSAGVNSYSIDASALPKGMYVVQAAGRSIKFVKL